MPNNFDFSKVENIKTIEVSPTDWVSPLYVEYGIYRGIETGEVISYCWRVKGTLHTFIIPTIRLDFISSGDYKKHFENALAVFAQDYLSWKSEGFLTEWSREYQKQFGRFINL